MYCGHIYENNCFSKANAYLNLYLNCASQYKDYCDVLVSFDVHPAKNRHMTTAIVTLCLLLKTDWKHISSFTSVLLQLKSDFSPFFLSMCVYVCVLVCVHVCVYAYVRRCLYYCCFHILMRLFLYYACNYMPGMLYLVLNFFCHCYCMTPWTGCRAHTCGSFLYLFFFSLSLFVLFFFFFIGLLLSCACVDMSGIQLFFVYVILNCLEPEARCYKNAQINQWVIKVQVQQEVLEGQ